MFLTNVLAGAFNIFTFNINFISSSPEGYKEIDIIHKKLFTRRIFSYR